MIGPDERSQDLRGLQCVVSVSGEVRVDSAPLLRGLDGLERLVGQDGLAVAAIRLSDNPSLHDISALAKPRPQRIRDIENVQNPLLVGISGLAPVLRDGSEHIANDANDATLASVTLPDLTRINSLKISGHDALTDISALVVNRRTPPTIFGVHITNNGSLPPGQIDRVLGRAHTFPAEGEWEISGNGVVQKP